MLLCVIALFCSIVIGGPDIPRTDGYLLRYDAPALVFLAHNDYDGQYFAAIQEGDVIEYDAELYRVTEIIQAQALTPNSPASDLVWDGRTYTHVEAWQEIYNQPDTVVMQTCIRRGNVASWGRLFIIAIPYRLDPRMGVIF